MYFGGFLMSVKLYSHNQETYDRLTKMFETGDRVGVVQPTGTGKSFLFLKWIEDHPRDKIAFLSPSVEIFNQLSDFVAETNDEALLSNVEMITYQTLNNMTVDEISKLHFDKIIIDEFHRTGAEQWGPSLQHLLDVNTDAKVLGATATPVRYLDNAKDMADEIFSNNLARYMTLGEAVEKGILPTPNYVPVWYDYDNKLKQYQEDIDSITNPNDRAELEEKLQDLKNNLQNSYGAEDIFAKHMPSNHGKYIVFCRDYEHLQEMLKTVPVWLSKVNPNVNSYISISREKDKDDQLKAFKEDNSEDVVKLLFTIDRLNEGLHVKGIDGVIMLRPTTSPIIYLQQMGRALSSGSKSSVIFDMVNNYMNVREPSSDGKSINVFEKEFKDSFSTRSLNAKDTDKKPAFDEQFRIFDQMVAFSELFNSLENSLYLDNEERWQKNFALFKEFKEEHGRLPYSSETYKDINLGSWLNTQKNSYKNNILTPEREELLCSIGVEFDRTQDVIFEERWQNSFALLKEFVSEHGRFPHKRETYKDVNLGVWLDSQKQVYKKGKLTSEREELLRSVGVEFEPRLEQTVRQSQLPTRQQNNNILDLIGAATAAKTSRTPDLPNHNKDNKDKGFDR